MRIFRPRTRGDLRAANLSDACLQDANAARADFTSANLSGANLRMTNLSFVNLDDVNLAGAELRLAQSLTQAQLATAGGDIYTRLPAGLSLTG